MKDLFRQEARDYQRGCPTGELLPVGASWMTTAYRLLLVTVAGGVLLALTYQVDGQSLLGLVTGHG